MSTLYPRLPSSAARERYGVIKNGDPISLRTAADTTHLGQFYAPTGGTRATPERLSALRTSILEIAGRYGFPKEAPGQQINAFDNALARTLHDEMDVVPAEAAMRPIWAFLALVVLPDIAVWRFPNPPEDRVMATDITRHVLGRLWWRAELLLDTARRDDPYHLLGVFAERNFDRILARRRSIGGSPDLVRALAKEWPKDWTGRNERAALEDVLKHLMRRGAVQDLFGMPEPMLRQVVAGVISEVRHGPRPEVVAPVRVGRHARS